MGLFFHVINFGVTDEFANLGNGGQTIDVVSAQSLRRSLWRILHSAHFDLLEVAMIVYVFMLLLVVQKVVETTGKDCFLGLWADEASTES